MSVRNRGKEQACLLLDFGEETSEREREREKEGDSCERESLELSPMAAHPISRSSSGSNEGGGSGGQQGMRTEVLAQRKRKGAVVKGKWCFGLGRRRGPAREQPSFGLGQPHRRQAATSAWTWRSCGGDTAVIGRKRRRAAAWVSP